MRGMTVKCKELRLIEMGFQESACFSRIACPFSMTFINLGSSRGIYLAANSSISFNQFRQEGEIACGSYDLGLVESLDQQSLGILV